MSRLLQISLLFFIIGIAQSLEVDVVTVDPSGPCVGPHNLQLNINSGHLSGCISGTWQLVSGGGGSASSVGSPGAIQAAGNSGAFADSGCTFPSSGKINCPAGISTGTLPFLAVGPSVASTSVTTPASGSDSLFYNLSNSDHLTRKDSSGTFHDIEGVTGGLLTGPGWILGKPSGTGADSTLGWTFTSLVTVVFPIEIPHAKVTTMSVYIYAHSDTGKHLAIGLYDSSKNLVCASQTVTLGADGYYDFTWSSQCSFTDLAGGWVGIATDSTVVGLMTSDGGGSGFFAAIQNHTAAVLGTGNSATLTTGVITMPATIGTITAQTYYAPIFYVKP